MARPSDLDLFYGHRLRETVQATVATVDGYPMGIAGVIQLRTIRKFFTEYREGLRPFMSSITVWKGLVRALEFARTPTYAVESEDGGRFLQRLGFVHLGGDLWLR